MELALKDITIGVDLDRKTRSSANARFGLLGGGTNGPLHRARGNAAVTREERGRAGE